MPPLLLFPEEEAADSDGGEARTVTSAGARATEYESGAEKPSLQVAPAAPFRKTQATRLCFPGKSEVTVMEAVPSAAESGTGGPSATPLSPKTTTDSVTGEQAGVGVAPPPPDAESVTEHASYPTCTAGSMAVSGMP